MYALGTFADGEAHVRGRGRGGAGAPGGRHDAGAAGRLGSLAGASRALAAGDGDWRDARLAAGAGAGGARARPAERRELPPARPRHHRRRGAPARDHGGRRGARDGRADHGRARGDRRAVRLPRRPRRDVRRLRRRPAPGRGEQHDWELELACVLGPGGTIAGYTIANDLTTRDLVYRPDLKAIGTDWLRAKNAPTFLPLGPWIVPAASSPPGAADHAAPQRRRHAGRVDARHDLRRRAAARVHDRPVALFPGDLLLTGSPAGNGMHHHRFLRAGDVMECKITGLGAQRNRCVAIEEGAAHRSTTARPRRDRRATTACGCSATGRSASSTSPARPRRWRPARRSRDAAVPAPRSSRRRCATSRSSSSTSTGS